MKNFKSIIAISIFSLAILSSCGTSNKKATATSTSTEVKSNTKSMEDLNQNCYQDRQKGPEITNDKGTIKMISGRYMIVSDKDAFSRYLPCILPDSWNKEGLKVNFSGQVYLPRPQERNIGTLIQLTDLSKIKK
ncbi:MAG: hypothetical protein KBA06_01130 [Saprospiraceae bacterium]|nr:hypothetical protein [Saprospiraceae bacterium]